MKSLISILLTVQICQARGFIGSSSAWGARPKIGRCGGGGDAIETQHLCSTASPTEKEDLLLTSTDEKEDYSSITGKLQPSMFGDVPYLSTREVSKGKQHRVLFVLGGPGAGKGTQCERLVEQYKCTHLSVGELLRDERERNGTQAQLIESCLVAGQIVPVEISLGLLSQAMNEASSSSSSEEDGGYGSRVFLVDGFPRNFDNLDGWTKFMPDHSCVLGSLVFDCPVEELERRILSRGETSGRSDDNIASARKRFATFETQTMPVVRVLENDPSLQSCRVSHIAGEKSLEEVWDMTSCAMNEYVQNDVFTANQMLLDAITTQNYDLYATLVDHQMLVVPLSNFDDASAEYIQTEELYDTATTNKQKEGDAVDTESAIAASLKKRFLELECAVSGESVLSNTTIQIFGTSAVVSYDRSIISSSEDGASTTQMRETRVWHHKEAGW
eukprot:CAMPEP_0195519804 /NCGR_PEP_ID=MMETSP0794_2-20130614/15526_1 /TAXON_ID=515487 /ORGANISM="Stephanopyxis turris, Strain CCMP 815" /LENGTH=443 /DNA_ID=CAMNT_0040649025 /DNA_START=202 /DNA_END=1530 /DNA_ORIENTATION=+